MQEFSWQGCGSTSNKNGWEPCPRGSALQHLGAVSVSFFLTFNCLSVFIYRGLLQPLLHHLKQSSGQREEGPEGAWKRTNHECVCLRGPEEERKKRGWSTIVEEAEVDYFTCLTTGVMIRAHQIFCLQESGSVFRKVQQDRRFSRLGGVAWSICVGHGVSDT